MRAAWNARACAAGIATGAMIFCAGAGLAVPLSLNAAALSALPSLALAALCAWRMQRALRRPAGEPCAASRALFALLALSLTLCAAYIAGAQACLAEYTLLTRARMRAILFVTLLGCFACACCGGAAVERMCYLVRWALPALLLALGAKALQRGSPVGLFPVLGAGAGPLFASALCMLCAAAPALLPLACAQDEDREPELVPSARFFVLRVLAGGAAGAALLLSLTLCNTYDALLLQDTWGERMLVACMHEPRMGVLQMALVLTQTLALTLACAALLCAAGRSAARAVQTDGDGMARRAKAAMGVCLAACLAAVVAMNAASFHRSAYAAPLAALPALPVMLHCGGLRGKVLHNWSKKT